MHLPHSGIRGGNRGARKNEGRHSSNGPEDVVPERGGADGAPASTLTPTRHAFVKPGQEKPLGFPVARQLDNRKFGLGREQTAVKPVWRKACPGKGGESSDREPTENALGESGKNLRAPLRFMSQQR